jgi:hypothetical protein
VAATVPLLGLFLPDEPKVRLVDQGGGLEGLTRMAVPEALTRFP